MRVEEYLGDGVYVVFNGYDYILDLRAQDPVTRIVLEPSVMDALFAFRRRMQVTAKEEGWTPTT